MLLNWNSMKVYSNTKDTGWKPKDISLSLSIYISLYVYVYLYLRL